MSKSPHSKWPPPEETRVFSAHWSIRSSFWILLAACLMLYLFIYRPTAVRADKTAQSLQASYRSLVELGFTLDSQPELFLNEAERLRVTMIDIMHSVKRRKGFSEVFDGPFDDFFRVLEFEQRRFEILRNLEELAELSDARLPDNFNVLIPAYYDDADGVVSAELWLQLEFLNHFLTHLLSNDDGIVIELIESKSERRHGLENPTEELLEVRYRLKASARASTLANFLNAAALGTVNGTQRAIFFVEGILINRLANEADASTNGPHVNFDLNLCGFFMVPK